MARSSSPMIAFAAALFASTAFAQTIQIGSTNKTIAITATGEATQTADIAAITIGFEVFGPDPDAAYADGGRISQAVLTALHQQGVADKSIESTNQGLERYNDFDQKDTPAERTRKQFVMRQSWNVTVPPPKAAEVIRAAVAAGANQSGGIEWRVADRDALQARAAAAALVKARAIAAQMAEGLHVKLGDLLYASNQAPEAAPVPRPMLFHALAKAASPTPPPLLAISPQAVREEATVYAVFAIE